MTFDEWLKYGVDNGFCSEQVCETHEGLPIADEEIELYDDGETDLCAYAVRIGTPEQWTVSALEYRDALLEKGN